MESEWRVVRAGDQSRCSRMMKGRKEDGGGWGEGAMLGGKKYGNLTYITARVS
jgi:hypothetical protein